MVRATARTRRRRAAGPRRAWVVGERPRRRGAPLTDDAHDPGPAGGRSGEHLDPAMLRRADDRGARGARPGMRTARGVPGDRIDTLAAARYRIWLAHNRFGQHRVAAPATRPRSGRLAAPMAARPHG